MTKSNEIVVFHSVTGEGKVASFSTVDLGTAAVGLRSVSSGEGLKAFAILAEIFRALCRKKL
jgi:hypothetical protein